MLMKRPYAAAVGAALGLALYAPAAFAGLYPTQTCVSAKLKSAAKKCQSDLKAWSGWDNGGGTDNTKRDDALAKNATKLSDAWTKAETKSASKGVDCVDTTSTAADLGTAMDAAVADIVNTINTGLNLSNQVDAKCGAALIKAAAKKCGAFLKAESTYVKKIAKDVGGAERDAAQTKASGKFTAAFGQALTGCPTSATTNQIEGKVDDLSDSVLTDTTVSPNVPTTWTAVVPPTSIEYSNYTGLGGSHILTPLCSRNTPYTYYVKRGTGDGAHKLLVYYQGGGACWDDTTCTPDVGAFDDDVTPGDNPANTTTGFGDLNNPNNPFSTWNAVFVSYCTGDIHWGDNARFYHSPFTNQNYPIKHFGYQNAKVAEKWAREHFVNPDEIFVTGSSAGAYGAVLHGIILHDVYPASQFNVIGDAGNGVITQTFLQNNLEPAWKVQQHLPTFIPGLNGNITTLTISDLYGRAAAYYAPRDTRFAMYTSAWDGGGGSQTFFYNVMLNGVLDSGNWWHSSCAWNANMKQNDVNAFTLAPNNFRYYIGPGSRHTIYGSNRVYTETHGGVPPFVDWINDMRAGAPGWTNVECSDCSLLGACDGASPVPGASCQHDAECSPGVCTPIDARPSPGQNPPNPFLADGVVSCPP